MCESKLRDLSMKYDKNNTNKSEFAEVSDETESWNSSLWIGMLPVF